MDWVTVIWSMIVSACLTLAAMHVLVWFKKRTAWANLLFALTSIAMAALAACELSMMHARTPAQYGFALRMLHIPAWAIIVSLAGFVRLYMRAGRLWLAWSACGLRTLSLILNFIFTPNLNFREISALRNVRVLGESVSIPEGTPNPWMLVGQAGLFLLGVFIIDAALTVWKRGNRRQALLVGIPSAFFILAAFGQAMLVSWKIIPVPLTVSLFCMGFIAVMAYEMSRGMFRAEQLSDDLLKNERRLNDIIFNIGDWVWETDENGVYIYSSPQGFELLGRVIGKTPFDFMPPDEAERMKALFFDTAAKRMPFHDQENWNTGKDGKRICFLTNALPIFDEKGNFRGYRGVDKDITARKQTEEALVESEARYRMLFESAPEGILLIGPDGCVHAANIPQARLYGYESPQQLKGMYAPLFVAEQDRERAALNMRELLKGKELRDRSYTAVRQDGSELAVEVTSVILRGPRQEVQGYLCLTRDVTESKQNETERVQLRLELAHLARVMTMNELSGSLAHEINQPLGAILNNASAAKLLLSRVKDKPEDVNEIIEDIIKDAKRAGDVVRKIRGMVKKGEMEYEPVQLNALIEEVIALFRNAVSTDKVSINLELTPDLAKVKGDRVHLQQVLLNLITNALEAVKESPSKILTVRSALRKPDTVIVSVSDSGPGINEAIKDIVFKPFFTTKKGGLGFGLAICRSIIEEHGGKIWVGNNPDKGATIAFSLKVWKQGPA